VIENRGNLNPTRLRVRWAESGWRPTVKYWETTMNGNIKFRSGLGGQPNWMAYRGRRNYELRGTDSIAPGYEMAGSSADAI